MNLNQVTIPATDVIAAADFYQNLGLKLIVDALPRYVRFECPIGDSTLSIHQVSAIGKGDWSIVYFEVENLDSYVKTLQQRGISFEYLPQDQPWLWREAKLKDPDGNEVILYKAGKNRKYPPWRVSEEKQTEASVEIERKFLVTSETFEKEAQQTTRIVQGFLNTAPERTVRVRIKGERGYLTVKGKSNELGTSRFEWEKEIAVAEAEQLLKLCEEGVIEKLRYEVPLGSHTFEVDVFLGENKGLVVAEVELQHEEESFERPSWLGEEVTGDVRYYNSNLSTTPFSRWHKP